MAESGFSAPLTSSMGRLFDAVAALCGLRSVTTYEGQAAIELEAIADRSQYALYELPVDPGGRLDARPTILDVVADLQAGVGAGVVSARFHRSVAAATATACAQAAAAAGTDRVVLSGGVFQNRLLLDDTSTRLRGLGLRVLAPALFPANDGGISYGQSAIAAARSA
jgi:hydrogenase maturation protein HypF